MRIPTEDSIKKNVTILELGDIKNYDMYAYMTSYYLYNQGTGYCIFTILKSDYIRGIALGFRKFLPISFNFKIVYSVEEMTTVNVSVDRKRTNFRARTKITLNYYR